MKRNPPPIIPGRGKGAGGISQPKNEKFVTSTPQIRHLLQQLLNVPTDGARDKTKIVVLISSPTSFFAIFARGGVAHSSPKYKS